MQPPMAGGLRESGDAAAIGAFYEHNRVVFLYPEVATASSFSISGKHLGASYVRAYLKARGIATRQFTAPPGSSLDEVVGRLADEAPAFLGITVYDCTYHTVKMLLRELKARRPEVTVLLGGPTPTFSDAILMEDLPEADVCVRGEGEATAYEVLEALRRGQDLSKIRGITYRNGGSASVRNLDRPLARGEDRPCEMDVVPSPYLEGILTPADGRQVGILTARGCTFRCVYCNFAAMSRWTVRYHSVERVLSELAYIARSQPGDARVPITIQDDAFTLHKERAKEICRRIMAERLPVRVDCETRADAVDDELLELMAAAGFKDMHFGVESGAPRVLRAIKKASSDAAGGADQGREIAFLKRVRRAVRKSRSLGLKPTVSIILGLPTETASEGRASVDFVASLDRCRYYHNYLEIFAGTELFESHRQYGIELTDVHRTAVNRLYRTRHAYDVSAIPVLAERSVFDVARQAADLAAQLCGDGCMGPPAAIARPSLVAFVGGFPDASGCAWFMRTAATRETRLVLLQPCPQSPGEPAVHELFMPLQTLYWLRRQTPARDGRSLLEAAIAGNAENFIPYRFLFQDVRAHGLQGRGPAAAGDAAQHVFQLAPGPDVEAQVALLMRVHDGARAGVKRGAQCLDVCRWSPAPCLAPCLPRAVVDAAGRVFPCFSGCAVGDTGEPVEVLRLRLARLATFAEAARGCRRCPVQSACARCLFPHPMDERAYCAIQRRRLGARAPGGREVR